MTQKGMVLPLVAAMAAGLFGIVAMAIDVGHYLVVRSELRNAASVAALAGANKLYPLVNGKFDYTMANQAAKAVVVANFADGEQLQVQGFDSRTGFVNVTPGSINNTLYSESAEGVINITNDITQSNLVTNTSPVHMAAAYRVSVQKPTASMVAWFGRVVGFDFFVPSATATAIVPTGVQKKADTAKVFPLAMSQCIYDAKWDRVRQAPKSGEDQPFKIANHQPIGACENQGNWTGLSTNQTNTAALRDLIQGVTSPSIEVSGNKGPCPTTFDANQPRPDCITMAPRNAARPNLYDSTTQASVKRCITDSTCRFVLLPVVNNVGSEQNGQRIEAVTGLACVELIDAKGQGNDGWIEIRLIRAQTQPQCRAIVDADRPGNQTANGIPLPAVLSR